MFVSEERYNSTEWPCKCLAGENSRHPDGVLPGQKY